jgi:acetyltransferase-like isoleucine patch superfamily enzyme
VSVVFFDAIVRIAFRRFRGKEITISPEVSSASVLVHLVRKGFGPFLRGMITKPFLGSSAGSLFLGRGCKILSMRKLRTGKNVYIGGYSYLDCMSTGGVTLGDNVTIREGCWLQLTSRYDNPGASVTIGNSVYIGPRSVIGAAAPITIGDHCQFGASVSLLAENHQFAGDLGIFEQGVSRKGISIGRDVWIGANATILDGVSIGDGAVIGAGTVVTSLVPPRSVVVGVPGRVIKTR